MAETERNRIKQRQEEGIKAAHDEVSVLEGKK
jgi:hypothetical protein